MKRFLASSVLAVLLTLFCSTAARAGDLEDISGKWTTQKTNDQGQKYSQELNLNKDKFVFKILSGDGTTILYAKGEFKLATVGSIKVLKFSNIEGGRSEDSLKTVDDQRDCPYVLNSEKLYMVINFDKERDKAPSLEIYRKSDK